LSRSGSAARQPSPLDAVLRAMDPAFLDFHSVW
jgi:hypothetical protein